MKEDGTQANVEAGTRCYRNVYYKDKYTQCGTLKLLILGLWDFKGCSGLGDTWGECGQWDKLGQRWIHSPRLWMGPGNDQDPRSCTRRLIA